MTFSLGGSLRVLAKKITGTGSPTKGVVDTIWPKKTVVGGWWGHANEDGGL